MAEKKATLVLQIKQTGAKVLDKTKTLLKGLSVAVVAFAAASLKAFGTFEDKFTNVVTLLDEGSFKTKTLTKGIDDLKKGVLALSAETGESFDDLNQGLFDLISAGVKADDAMDALRVATDLAAAGGTNTAVSVKALTASLTSFGSEAGTAQEIAEKFFTAQKFGVTTVEELAREFNKVAGLSKELGLSFDETLASATALTANGAKPTSVAFTEMRAVLVSVINAQKRLKDESPAVQKAFSLQNVKTKGLNQALKETFAALGGNTVKFKALLESAEAYGAAVSLTGAQSELTAKILKEMGDETNRAATFQAALAAKTQNVERTMRKLRQQFLVVLVTVGERLAPAFVFLSDIMRDFALNVSENKAALNGLLTVIKAVVKGAFVLKAGFVALGDFIGTTLASKFLILSNILSGDFKKAFENSKLEFQEVRKDITNTFSKLQQDLKKIDGLFVQDKVEQKAKLLELEKKGSADTIAVKQAQSDNELAIERIKTQKIADDKAAAVQAETEKRLEDEALFLEEINARDQIRNEQLFANEEQRLGIELQAINKKIANEKDFQKKKSLLIQKNDLIRQQRDIKVKKQEEAAEQRFAQARVNIASGAANLIAAVSGQGSKIAFLATKAAALAQAIVATNLAAAQALAVPPAPNAPLAASAKIAGGLNIAAIAATTVKGLAAGGIVTPSPGGTSAIIGEGGRSEAVIPLPDDFDPDEGLSGGTNITINVNGGLLGTQDEAREFAIAVDRELLELRRNNESDSFDEDVI